MTLPYRKKLIEAALPLNVDNRTAASDTSIRRLQPYRLGFAEMRREEPA